MEDKEKVLIFGHQNPDTDSICSALVEAKLNQNNGWNAEAVRLGTINKETQYVLDYLGIEAPRLIEEVQEGQSVILVDHNEFNQSVKGIEKAKIEAVTDHHKIANFQTTEPLYYTARPYGCTSTILYEEYKTRFASYMPLEKKEATLMASAIISDTLLLKSPTTTKYDIQALEELAKIAEIDVNTYGIDLLKAGTDLDDFSEEQLIRLDAKNLEKDGKKYIIAQVNTINIEDVLKREKEIKEVILKEIQEKDLCLFVFVITDILNSNSEVIALGKETQAVEKGFSKVLEDDKVFLKGVVSRKKQLIPNIDSNL